MNQIYNSLVLLSIPIDEDLLFCFNSYHWSLIVMCHLGEVATYEGESLNECKKVLFLLF